MSNVSIRGSAQLLGFKENLKKFAKRIVGPHPSIIEIGEKRQATLLGIIALVMVIATLTGSLTAFMVRRQIRSAEIGLWSTALLSLVAYLLSRTPYHKLGGWFIVLPLSASAFLTSALGVPNLSQTLLSNIPLAYVLGSVVLSLRGMALFTLLNTVGVILLTIPTLSVNYTPADIGTNLGQVISIGVLFLVVISYRNNIENDRLKELQDVNEELRDIRTNLEKRVADRIRDLGLAAEISRTVSLISELDRLLPEAVRLIQERFDLYYTQIFLLDPARRTLILRAGTGEVGEKLLMHGHRLPVDAGSLNGLAVERKQVVIVADTSNNLSFKPNVLLPETRSEMAIPLIIDQDVVGVLDLQSAKPGALAEETLPAFEALAGQLAIAIQKAALFEQVQQSREQITSRARQLTQHGWDDYLNAIDRDESLEYVYDQGNPQPLKKIDHPNGLNLIIPISILGIQVGSIELERDSSVAWRTDDKVIVQSVAITVAKQLENLRLLSQAEKYRSEAEAAARRLTREGWQSILHENPNNGYMYDQIKVMPLSNPIKEVEEDNNDVSLPLSVSNVTIGKLQYRGGEIDDPDIEEFVKAVVERLSVHLENLRLSNQTQKTLSETDTLLGIIADLNAAQNYHDVLSAIANRSILKEADQSLVLCLFDKPKTQGHYPEWVIPVSYRSDLPIEIAARYPLNAFELEPNTLFTNQPVIIEGIDNDPRLDRITRALFVNVFRSQSCIIIPLLLGDQSLGFIMGGYSKIIHFHKTEIQRLASIASQTAIAVQGLQLLDHTIIRAQREQILREINAKVNSAVDTDTILRHAVTEIGRVLKKQTFVYLGNEYECFKK